MDESEEILLNSLHSSGISLPSEISSIKDLTPDALFSICAQFILSVDDSSPSFPASLPVSTAERFKICTDIASAIKSIGYRGNLSFHQFLYPSEEDSHSLVRFLVERLSESSEYGNAANNKSTSSCSSSSEAASGGLKGGADDVGENPSNQAVLSGRVSLEAFKEGSSVPFDTVADVVHSGGLCDSGEIPGHSGGSADPASPSGDGESCDKNNSCSKETVEDLSEEIRISKGVLCLDGESVKWREKNNVSEPEQELASPQTDYEAENLRSQDKMLMEAIQGKTLEVRKLEDECGLLRAAVEMAFDDQHSVEFYVGDLDEQVEARRKNIMNLESQWSSLKQTLEEKMMALEQSLQSLGPVEQEKFNQLKEVDREAEATMSEIHKCEVEHSELLMELGKLPKLPSRKSYIQRITEITRNSWKQDADIDKILQETRELQLESNSIRERLHRTYAVVDETVFREAKKDPAGRLVYRILTSIHDGFEQISEKILATDRARREAAEQVAKLATLSSRGLDISKLQSDLDSIRRENEILEQKLRR